MSADYQDVSGSISTCHHHAPPAAATAHAAPSACGWTPDPTHQPAPGEPADGRGGHWYAHLCRTGAFADVTDLESTVRSWHGVLDAVRADQLAAADLHFAFAPTRPTGYPAPRDLIRGVAATLPVPPTRIGLSPAAPDQLVGLPTWVWLRGRHPATMRTGQLRLDAHAVTWTADATLVVRAGQAPPSACAVDAPAWYPGADAATACTTTPGRAGHEPLTATLSWTVRWSLDGAAQPDLPGPTRTATTELAVREVQAVGATP